MHMARGIPSLNKSLRVKCGSSRLRHGKRVRLELTVFVSMVCNQTEEPCLNYFFSLSDVLAPVDVDAFAFEPHSPYFVRLG